MENVNESAEQKAPSHEEMQERQAELHAYYESQIPFLQVQKEYETLVTELEELEARRIMTRVKLAQIMAPPPKESAPGEETSEAQQKVRTLKK